MLPRITAPHTEVGGHQPSRNRPVRTGPRRTALWSVLVVVPLVLSSVTGCGSPDPDDHRDQQGADPVTSLQPATGSTDPDQQAEDSSLAEVVLNRIEVELDSPLAAIAVPAGHGIDNGLIVAERAGTIRVLDLSTSEPVLSGPVLDIRARVSTEMERGLLGIALTPDERSLVVSFTDEDGNSRIESYPVSWVGNATPPEAPLVLDTTSPRTLLTVDQPYANHNGGHVEFGPDGMLYLGLGDGGAGGDPHGNAQDRSTLLGKMVRLDPSGRGPGGLAPADNPFVDVPGARPEIWATGLRNPWRFSFDPETGDLWIADVGQDRFEEIDHLPAAEGTGRGANLGWDLYEGYEEFDHPDPAPPPASDGPFVEPVFVYPHGPGCSVTGGVVYRGRAIPPLVGRYLFSDLCDGRIRTLAVTGSGSAREPVGIDQIDLAVEVNQPVGFAVDTEGEVYVLSLTSGIYRMEPA